jgi:hypothetical protein
VTETLDVLMEDANLFLPLVDLHLSLLLRLCPLLLLPPLLQGFLVLTFLPKDRPLLRSILPDLLAFGCSTLSSMLVLNLAQDGCSFSLLLSEHG